MNDRIAWYLNRLRCMSPPEIIHRCKTAATISAEKWGVTTARKPPRAQFEDSQTTFWIHKPAGLRSDAYRNAADRILDGRYSIFSLDDLHLGHPPEWNRDPKTGRRAPMRFGRAINYRDQDEVGDIKYLWELNRHLELVTVAQAYVVSDDHRYLEGLGALLRSWIQACPYPLGVNWASSLELAIRLINWSITWQLVGGLHSRLFQGAGGDRLRDDWLGSVYQHVHAARKYLSAYSSANNHLIGELAGVFIATVTWPYWPEFRSYRDLSKAQLEQEALAQNSADGVNREQAVSYQQFVLDFLLFSALAGRSNGIEFSAEYWQRCHAMMVFLADLMDCRGHMPMVGDADDGFVTRLSPETDGCAYRSLLATGAFLYSDSYLARQAGHVDEKTRWLLGDKDSTRLSVSSGQTDVSRPRWGSAGKGGYYLLGRNLGVADEVRLLVDAAPLGYLGIAAHGHADALSFVLSISGYEVLIDPGTYAYHTNKEWRDYFRGSRAHNTVVVDGMDQSTSGGNFMWIKHAQAKCEEWSSSDEEDRFVGSHDGYLSLSDPVLHRREIRLSKRSNEVRISDLVVCERNHAVERYWHFSEDCSVETEGNRITVRNGPVHVLLLNEGDRSNDEVEVLRGSTTPIGGWVSRRFDSKSPTTTIAWKSEVAGPTTLVTRIEYRSDAKP